MGKTRTTTDGEHLCFPDKGKACPYAGEFAVESIRQWWKRMGQPRYPQAIELLITADGGGSNGYRTRLWKHELQQLANELGLSIRICHFPPGTSKWNKIEHRMFSLIAVARQFGGRQRNFNGE